MSLLGDIKDKSKEKEKSEIDHKYCIEKTSRNWKKKINNQKTNKSSVADHIVKTNHSINAVELVKHLTNNLELNIREIIEMLKNRNNSLNLDLNLL